MAEIFFWNINHIKPNLGSHQKLKFKSIQNVYLVWCEFACAVSKCCKPFKQSSGSVPKKDCLKIRSKLLIWWPCALTVEPLCGCVFHLLLVLHYYYLCLAVAAQRVVMQTGQVIWFYLALNITSKAFLARDMPQFTAKGRHISWALK